MAYLDPGVIDHAQPGGNLISNSYDPLNGLSKADFIARYWNRDSVNYDGSLGGWRYPPNEGFDESPGISLPKATDLPVGFQFDRFGEGWGSFVSPVGTTFEGRGLPPDSAVKDYHVYETMKPFDGVSGYPVMGTAAKAFEQNGGGIQIKLPHSADWLVEFGYIKAVRP